ncbi:MAG: hypothetical protein II940_01790, partial [Methanosarcinaceae archaeon]|nr:hypothetical protein [Methanosarcinaceae archaeon]
MRKYFCILTAVLILLSIGGMADAATYSKEQIAQDPELQELINNVSATDPNVLEETRKGRNVKAVFGQIPQCAAGEETY